MRKRILAQGLTVLAFMLAGASPAPAVASAGGCASVSASAVDQYCEMTPTAGGNRVPGSLHRTVAGTLAAPKRRALGRTRTGRLLLALPARQRLHDHAGTTGSGPAAGGRSRGASVNALSLSWPLIAVLGAIALSLITVAVRRRAGRRAT